MGVMGKLFLVAVVSLVIAGFWSSVPIIKQSIHLMLDPSAGALLNWNVDVGMIVISAMVALALTLTQKYTTDQETLKKIKQEQKILQEEIKKYREHPEKLVELQKKQLEFLPRTMEITMRPLLYTAIPIILFIRWFGDYFASNPVKIFGFFSWIWAYILLSIIGSIVFRKLLRVY